MGYRYCLLAVAAVVTPMGQLHPLGLGLIEIGVHCPNMARIARSRLARISTHLARSSGSHTNSDTPVGMQFGVVLVAALELFA
jgi:hypothetical protein